jgi:hypothetical protein
MQKRERRASVAALALLAAVMFLGLPAFAASIDARFVGTYRGQFLGELDYGTFVLAVDAEGVILGDGMSTKREVPLAYSGSCNPDGTLTFSTVDGSMIFTGSIDWMNRISGKWARADNSARGSFGGIIQKQ